MQHDIFVVRQRRRIQIHLLRQGDRSPRINVNKIILEKFDATFSD